jgi:biotin carboxylase
VTAGDPATLLLIGAGRMGTPYLHAAGRLGVDVVLVETAVHRERLAPQCALVLECAGSTDEQWAATAFDAARRVRPDGVLAFTEPQVMAAGLLQSELGLPGPSLRAAVISRNKALQRARFGVAGIAQPDHRVAVAGEDDAEVVAWARSRLPVIVKPLSLAGSEGVTQLRSADALRAVLVARAGETVLVEQMLIGPEYSWEGIVNDGRLLFANVTAKETTGPPDFVEVAHRAGVLLDAPVRPDVDALAARVIAALGMRTGIVHLEFIVAAAGPAVVEVAVRMPGDYIMDVVGRTYGFDPFETLVRLALGLDVPPPPPKPVAFAASWFPVLPAGRVTAVHGAEDVRNHPDVFAASIRVAAGDVLPQAHSSEQRFVHVLLHSATPERRERALAEVRAALSVDIAPTPDPSPSDAVSSDRGR